MPSHLLAKADLSGLKQDLTEFLLSFPDTPLGCAPFAILPRHYTRVRPIFELHSEVFWAQPFAGKFQ